MIACLGDMSFSISAKSKQRILALNLDLKRHLINGTCFHSRDTKGFRNKWCSWAKSILSSDTYVVFLNGVYGYIFKCKRGVRQSDPVSPLSFILAAKYLQDLVNNAMENGLLEKPLTTNSFMYLPIIQYADDALVISKASEEHLTHLKTLLRKSASILTSKLIFKNPSWCLLTYLMVNVVLSSLPTFIMSFLKMYKVTIQELDKYKRNDFWRGKDLE